MCPHFSQNRSIHCADVLEREPLQFSKKTFQRQLDAHHRSPSCAVIKLNRSSQNKNNVNYIMFIYISFYCKTTSNTSYFIIKDMFFQVNLDEK